MPIDAALLTAGGTQLQITPLAFGVTIPPEITITCSAAIVGATSVSVVISTQPTPAKPFYAGMTFKVGTAPNEQWVVLAADAAATATSFVVEPLTRAITASSVAKSYAGIPLIGLEAANMQLQTETNQAVLLANDGWRNQDYSTGSFEFSGTLYIPTNPAFAGGAYLISDALLAKQNLYVERILPNGLYHAGMCIVSSASDQTQGAQYISQNLTLSGSGKLRQVRLNP